MKKETEASKVYKRVGENLAFLRKSKKITQTELARELKFGNGQSIISQYENGKKSISLETMEEICAYFSISLKDFMFCDFKSNSETERVDVEKILPEEPIHKCANRTYYCYYIKEQNDGKRQFSSQVASFKLEVYKPVSSHSAKVKIFLEKRNTMDSEKIIDGILYMDESYAYIESHNLKKDFFFELTFYYHRQSLMSKYKGGMGLLQKMDYHRLPVCQFCVISQNAIATKNFKPLENLLRFNTCDDINMRLSNRVCSSAAVLRLTKNKDGEVFDWLRRQVGI